MNALKFDRFNELREINEGKLDKKPFDPKFASKVATLAAYIKDQIEGIAQDLAIEKHLRDPKNYPDTTVTEIDRSRALKLIFHTDWKNHIINGEGGVFVQNARQKAEKKDDQAHKKNKALALKMDDKKIDFLGTGEEEEGFGFHQKGQDQA